MEMRKKLIVGSVVLAFAASLAYATFEGRKEAVDFYNGHTHVDGKTVGAPDHSGGTDRYGCHNASVPYHCH
jgi:hypothetical protein